MKVNAMILLLVVFGACVAGKTHTDLITSDCELRNSLNDTITVKGIYSKCMEYSGFSTVQTDSCSKYFSMQLRLGNLSEQRQRLENALEEVYDTGCGASFELTAEGILKKERKNGYGHLGSNDVEFVILKVLNVGKVKVKKGFK